MLAAAVEPDYESSDSRSASGLKTGRDHVGRQKRLHNPGASRGGSAASRSQAWSMSLSCRQIKVDLPSIWEIWVNGSNSLLHSFNVV